MPVYNGEKYLKEAVDSVLSQTYTNIELVMVNDGSTDTSKQIIRSYTDPRIRYIENESNGGIVYSRNRGLTESKGQYVATLDCDDIALPERISRQVDFLQNNPEYGMCGSFYRTIDSEGNFLEKIHFPTENTDIISHLLIGNCFCNSTVMIRRDIAKDLKYREKFDIVEDYELWYRISKRAKLANLAHEYVLYRVHGTNISAAKLNDMLARLKKINEEILRDLDFEFTEQELEIHAGLLNRNIEYFRDPVKFAALEKWIMKFFNRIQKSGRYNTLLIYKLLMDKWIVFSFNTRNYRRIFSNRLIALNRSAYLNTLIKRILFKVKRTA
jgi:glycosyltransferase involved in cell wall biosynthesis